MSNYKDVKSQLILTNKTTSVDLPGFGATAVKKYLPIQEKAQLINDVLRHAATDMGTFSKVRIETYFALNVLKYYAGIEVDDEDVPDAYDSFCSYEIFAKVIKAIPYDEYDNLEYLMDETVKNIETYNNSLAGMLGNMSSDASQLEGSMRDIFARINSEEGAKALDFIKAVGKTN